MRSSPARPYICGLFSFWKNWERRESREYMRLRRKEPTVELVPVNGHHASGNGHAAVEGIGNRSERGSRSARGARPPTQQGEDTEIRVSSPCESICVAFFAFSTPAISLAQARQECPVDAF